MALIRRTNSWLPSVFNDFFDYGWMENSTKSIHAVNIQQNDEGFIVEVAAPGMTKEDCVVRLDENKNLVISFEKKSENEEVKKGTYLKREFSYSQFQKTMLLPDDVDEDKITANVKDGILSIEIPTIKEKTSLKDKLIEIK